MASAKDAIRSARVYLNDINGISWSDALLMPLLQEAHSELVQELELNNTGVLKIQSSPITIPANSTDMAGQQPSNIINPISILEGNVGDDPEFFQDMTKVTFLPYIDKTSWLTYWAWIAQNIVFVGATVARNIILRYEGAVTTPQILTDPLGCIFAERYLGPRIASLAYITIGKENKRIQDLADKSLYKLIQSQVVNDQRPTRRKGYRSRKGFSGPSGVSSPLAQSGRGSVVTWVPTSTPADGIRTTFIFPLIPNYVSWNGLNQFANIGYKLSVVSGQYVVTFQDINGNVLTPSVGDDIRAQIN